MFVLLMLVVFVILTGRVVPRRELKTARELIVEPPVGEVSCGVCKATGSQAGSHHLTSCPMYRYQSKFALATSSVWDGVWTQAEILECLPQWMRADFDCPARGAHEWTARVTSRRNHYEFCHHCNRTKRTVDEWPDTERDALEVIYALQFSR